MAFTLNEELVTGNELIDKEHGELLQILNDFIGITSTGQEKQTLEILQFLVKYVKTHFSHEETLQKQSNYPKYEKHAKIHRHLEGAVLDAQKEFENKGFSYQLSAMVIVRIGGCIMAHILSEDKEFAKYLEEKDK